MKKISLISLTTLLFCSMVWFSCQKSKDVIPPKDSNNRVNNNQPMTPTTPVEDIGHALSAVILSMESTPLSDWTFIMNTVNDQSLTEQQKESTLLTNSYAATNISLVQTFSNICSTTEAQAFLNNSNNELAVFDVFRGDIGYPTIQDIDQCRLNAIAGHDQCNGNLEACALVASSLNSYSGFVVLIGCTAQWLTCSIAVTTEYEGCAGINIPGGGTNFPTPATLLPMLATVSQTNSGS